MQTKSRLRMIFRYSRLRYQDESCDRVLYNGDYNSAFALYCMEGNGVGPRTA